MKLNRASLADQAGWAAAHVELPQYDVAAVAEATKKAPTWVHFGTGNIFRAYIAALAQRMLNEGLTDKGLLMANTNDPAILDIAYTPFDNLCIAVTLNPDATTSREIIGSIAEGIKADSSDEAAMTRFREIFSDPGLQMLSFTITLQSRWDAAARRGGRYEGGPPQHEKRHGHPHQVPLLALSGRRLPSGRVQLR